MRGRTAALILALAGVAGCQPLYGNRPDPMRKPPTSKPPKGGPTVATTPPPPVEVIDCPNDFQRPPTKVRKQAAAEKRVAEGDAEVALAPGAPDDLARAQVYRVGLDRYTDALKFDPYHAEATLKLAVTYDTFHRKGCALALLARLGDLQANPEFAGDANRAANQVASNKQWFRTYRADALTAVNRPVPPTNP